MKTILSTIVIMLSAVCAFGAAGNQLSKPQNEIIMSGEATLPGWTRSLATITNVETRLNGNPATLVFEGTWFIGTNWTAATNLFLKFEPGTMFSVYSNRIMNLQSNQVDWTIQPTFTGLGTVTGAIRCDVSYHPIWSNNVSFYYLTGGTLNNTNTYLTTITEFGGDVSGVYSNLQLGTNVVALTNLAQEVINYINNGDTNTAGSAMSTNLSYAFAVYMTRSTFALPAGWSYTNVPVFEGTNYDFTGGGCLASNRFFVPVSGLWHFEGGLYDDAQASSYDLTAAITTNFTGVGDFIGIGPIAATNSAAGDLCSPVQCEFYLPAGTAVSLAAFNGSGSPKTIQSVLNLRIEKPYFRGHLIAK